MKPSLLCLLIFAYLGACTEQPKYLGKKLTTWEYELEDKEAFKRVKACEALASMGEVAYPSTDKVIALLKDTEMGVRAACSQALAKLGPKGEAALRETLKGKEPFLKLYAASALARKDQSNTEALKVLVETLCGVGNEELSRDAQKTIVFLKGATVPHLVEALKDPYLPAQLVILDTFRRIGPPAKDAAPAILGVLSEQSAKLELRIKALNAAADVIPKDVLKPVFEAMTEGDNESLADRAAVALKDLGIRESVSGNEGLEEEEAVAKQP